MSGEMAELKAVIAGVMEQKGQWGFSALPDGTTVKVRDNGTGVLLKVISDKRTIYMGEARDVVEPEGSA